jgi:hypothetical protein
VRTILRSVVFYPVTIVYLAAVITVGFVVESVLRPEVALLGLGVIAMLTVVVTVLQDVQDVHTLVNSQHDDLLVEVAHLKQVLEANHIPVPDTRAESQARLEDPS